MKGKAMTKKDLKEADLPEADNPSQNSQTANSIRNQSSVRPEDYPEIKHKARKRREGAGKQQ